MSRQQVAGFTIEAHLFHKILSQLFSPISLKKITNFTTFHRHFFKIFRATRKKNNCQTTHFTTFHQKNYRKFFYSPKSSYFSNILTFFQKFQKNFIVFQLYSHFFQNFLRYAQLKIFQIHLFHNIFTKISPKMPISPGFTNPQKAHLFHQKFHW